MNLRLPPVKIGGKIRAIASKSQAHRLLICAALSDAPSKILCADRSADIDATARCLNALGAKIEYCDGAFSVVPIQKLPKEAILDCGESGSTLRFMLPIAAALGVQTQFVMHGRLSKRPLSPLQELLQSKGICFIKPTEDTLKISGRLRAGLYQIAGNVSSQFVSGLLFALPLLDESSEIMLTSKLESAPYVDLTIDALRTFGIAPKKTENGWEILKQQRYCASAEQAVEGDWSNAAFWLCAGAVCAPMCVSGLRLDSAQGDREILNILRRFGAKIDIKNEGITVAPQQLHGIQIDASNIPDLVPPMALVACCASGTSRIFGAERLKIKESDRLLSVSQALNNLGGKVTVTADGLLIEGCALKGGKIDSQNDHRIAMLAAMASSVCSAEIELDGAQAVNKSYPDFWEDFRNLVISYE